MTATPSSTAFASHSNADQGPASSTPIPPTLSSSAASYRQELPRTKTLERPLWVGDARAGSWAEVAQLGGWGKPEAAQAQAWCQETHRPSGSSIGLPVRGAQLPPASAHCL